MTLLRLFVFCLGSLIALAAHATEIQKVTSPGGITAWLVEDHALPFTALNLAFRGGASLDAPDKRGAINLMVHTLEEGAGEMDATAFAAAAERLGAQIGFDVGDDALTVSARMLSENREPTADLIAAALSEPRFDEDAVARVRGQIEAVIRAGESDPDSIAAKELSKTVWGAHPYGSPVSGTVESLAALTSQDLVEAKDRVIARDRAIVAAAGDITPDQLGALIDRIFADLPQEGSAPLPEPAQFEAKGGVEVIDWDSPQTVVAFAQPGLSMEDPDYFAAYVANHILGGGGFSARLMDEIREKRGLSYGVSTALVNGVYGQSWQGGLSSSNASVAEAVDLVRQEWARLAEGVTDRELADAKTYLTGEYPLRWDGNSDIAGILAGMQLIGLPIDYPDTRNARIEAVTAEDVARVARTRLDPEKLQFLLVGRPEGLIE